MLKILIIAALTAQPAYAFKIWRKVDGEWLEPKQPNKKKMSKQVERNQGRIAAWKAKKKAERLASEKAAERLRQRLVRERNWRKIIEGFSKRVQGGGVGRAVTGIALLAVATAWFVCGKGGLGCEGKSEDDE